MMSPKEALLWEVAYARGHATEAFCVRDGLGRERWTEQPVDALRTRRGAHGPAFEDDLEELRRRA